MERIALIVDQFEEARRLIQIGDVSHLRMALLLLDNAAEVIMYRNLVDTFQYHEWQGRLIDRAQQIMSKDELAKFQEENDIRPMSAKDRKAVLRDYAAKVEFLVCVERKLPRAVGDVLKAIHRYRNEAYHRDKVRKETLRPAVIVLYDVATELFTRLPVGAVGYSSTDDWKAFCQRYGLSGVFDIWHGGLEKIASQLRMDVHLGVRDLAQALADHLMERIDGIERAIAFVAENAVGGLTVEQELKRIQFWSEHGIVPRDANDGRLLGYGAKYSEQDLHRWRAASIALVEQADKLELFGAFARIELEIEDLEQRVNEVASLVDQAIQMETDRRRGK